MKRTRLSFALLGCVLATGYCGSEENDPFADYWGKSLTMSSLAAGTYTLSDADQQILGEPMRIESTALTAEACGGDNCGDIPFVVSGNMTLYQDGFATLAAPYSFTVDLSDEEMTTDFPFSGTFDNVAVTGTTAPGSPNLTFSGFDSTDGGHLVLNPFGNITKIVFRIE